MRNISSPITVLITGGHLTPAIATIEEIRSRFPNWRILFVGRKHALEGNHVISEEYRLITGLKIAFFPIVTGRLKREGGLERLVSLAKAPIGLLQAISVVARERPTVIVSFGGYIALPIALAGRLLGVPVVTHEQTTKPGIANRLIAWIAQEVCVTYPDTAALMGGSSKVTITGLPIRKEVLIPPSTSPFRVPQGKPILLIVGGSTGSVSINDVVFKSLPELLRNFTLIHQVGRVSQDLGTKVMQSLPPKLKESYIIKSYLSAAEYSWAMHHAKIVIGRSGANTVMELILSATLAICIPLPWSGENEQFHNAEYMSRGGSLIIPQDTFTPVTLLQSIKSIITNWDERKALALRLSSTVPKTGARAFVSVIEKVINK